MKRVAAIALVVGIAVAVGVAAGTTWAQGADSRGSAGGGPATAPAAGSAGSAIGSPGASGSGAAMGSAPGSSGAGSAMGSAGLPSGAGSAMGTAPGSSGSGSAMGTAPGSGAGSAMGSAGSGSGARKPIVIIIPPDVQAPEVTAAASPSVVRLGDRFTLFITAKYVPGVEVNLVEPVDLGGAFEVKRKVSQDTTNADGTKTREWQIDVYAWEVGELSVPPLAVTFTSQGKAGQVATNSVPVNVTGVLGDLVDDPKLVRGNAPPVRLLSRDWFWVWVSAGVAVALVALVAVLMIRNSRKRRVRTLIGTLVASAPTPRRIDMTSERALEQLLAIQRSGVLDRDDDRKRGYAEMVEVIREYLGARYRVATLDLTSYELMRSLASVAPDDERTLVGDWLERCDIVKYGGFRATAGDANAVLDGARQLVIATTRAPGMSPSASGRIPAQPSSPPGDAA